MVLKDEEKWQAVIDCDVSYDGSFFYGVRTTGIFCRPSCKSKNPKSENVAFFATADQAQESGLRPCKRCRPDLLAFQPKIEMAGEIKLVYDNFYTDRQQLEEEINKLGISPNRVIQLFHDQFGETPVNYLNVLRIKKAKVLLISTQLTILQIALQSGFGSLSTFYKLFKRLVGQSPKDYRSAAGKVNYDHLISFPQ